MPFTAEAIMKQVKQRVAILVGNRGRGSNMEALVLAMQSGRVPAIPAVVLASDPDSPALARARALGVPIQIFGREGCPSLGAALEGIQLLCLAGYIKLLPPEIIQMLNGQVLNIHPALLPKYGGKGMYGRNVHKAVLDAGDSESGCSVHWVTNNYDEGAVILQRRCPVLPDDTPESLAARVLQLEHEAYPTALAQVLGED
ncbi:MAG: phosphoribosylglycinamide formyltransferase [Chthonomonas sp.]|nr:phosphoribosylglycinamide formyltransferase [Chthonomonas sp.]